MNMNHCHLFPIIVCKLINQRTILSDFIRVIFHYICTTNSSDLSGSYVIFTVFAYKSFIQRIRLCENIVMGGEGVVVGHYIIQDNNNGEGQYVTSLTTATARGGNTQHCVYTRDLLFLGDTATFWPTKLFLPFSCYIILCSSACKPLVTHTL